MGRNDQCDIAADILQEGIHPEVGSVQVDHSRHHDMLEVAEYHKPVEEVPDY